MHPLFAIVFLNIIFVPTSLSLEKYDPWVEEISNTKPTVSVYGFQIQDGSFQFQLNQDDYDSSTSRFANVVAKSWFIDKLNETGWNFQLIQTFDQIDDVVQAYWAGFVESYTTVNLTKAMYYNVLNGYCEEPHSAYCMDLYTNLTANFQWMVDQCVRYRETDAFWHQVGLQLWQLKGLEDGYHNTSVTSSNQLSYEYLKTMTIDMFGIYLLQLRGDLGEIEGALNPKFEQVIGAGSCSVLIKLLPDNSDLYTSHVTWTGYDSMLRVLKHYDTPFRVTAAADSPIIPGRRMSFSSYPSTANSIDDFYVMSSGLVTLETTNHIYNASLFNIIREGLKTSVFEMFRVQAANRLARTGAEWVQVFSQYNSGTYNNQWMVVDYNMFSPSEPLPDQDLLYVAEQMPGIIVSQDMTSVLKRNGYWASYNVPVFRTIYQWADYGSMAKKYGDFFTHDASPRALIFARDQGGVTNLTSMMRLMRYNDFTKDPLSRCACQPPYSADNGISSRNDLNDPNGTYPFASLGFRNSGATDLKLVTASLVKKLDLIAIGGPTWDDQPVFQWSTNPLRDTVNHRMQPDRWQFSPVVTPFSRMYGRGQQRN